MPGIAQDDRAADHAAAQAEKDHALPVGDRGEDQAAADQDRAGGHDEARPEPVDRHAEQGREQHRGCEADGEDRCRLGPRPAEFVEHRRVEQGEGRPHIYANAERDEGDADDDPAVVKGQAGQRAGRARAFFQRIAGHPAAARPASRAACCCSFRARRFAWPATKRTLRGAASHMVAIERSPAAAPTAKPVS